MKHQTGTLVLLMLLACPAMAEVRDRGPRRTLRSAVEGEVLVRYSGGNGITAFSGRRQVLLGMGAKEVKSLGLESSWVHVKLAEGISREGAMREIALQPGVVSVQPNFRYHTLALPNDPQFTNLWGMKNTAQTVPNGSYTRNNPGVAGKDMSLETAWNTITDCRTATVAIVDTGVNYNHTELAANMWAGGAAYPKHGFDFVDNDKDPLDLNGHGTHVAGTIGAVGNNATGVAGVCWRASLMAVRVLDASGSGTTADIVKGVDFAAANGAKVINMSLGGGDEDPAFRDAIKNAGAKGVTVVVAAGNENNDNDAAPSYPCSYKQPNLICVAALDQAYDLATFSNFGATTVHVGAPGTNVQSTWAGSNGSIVDRFNTGGTLNWTRSGNASWAYGIGTIQGNNYDVLTNPSGWDRNLKKYANNQDAKVYKNFNLAGVAAAIADFFIVLDTQLDKDFWYVAYKGGGGDPYGTGGVTVEKASGSTDGDPINVAYDLSKCVGGTCSVGFRLTSDASGVSFGAAVVGFSIETLTLNNTTLKTINGTSMATPHVAGLAALLIAFNPKFTPADVARAVQNGGTLTPSLDKKTISGKAANAAGSLRYISAPTGLAAAVL